MNFTLDIGNSVGLWLACLPLLILITLQVSFIYRQAVRSAPLVGLTPEERKTAFTVGLISAIGPAFASFISIIAMSAIMGGPVTWQRSSIIASPSTELRASQFTAEAAGAVLGGDGFTIQIFCACLFVMALNGCGWLMFCFIFTDKMNLVADKISSGSKVVFSAFATAAILGTVAYMSVNYARRSSANLSAFIGGVIASLIIKYFEKGHPKLKPYNYGLSMVVAMFCGALHAALTTS